MASTGINNGTLVALYIGGTKVSHSTNCSLEINNETIDVSTKDSGGWRDILAGMRSWSMSGDFFQAEDGTLNFEDAFDDVNGRTSVTARISTAVTGDVYYEGTAYVTSISMSGGVEDAHVYSMSLEGTAALSKGTVA